MSITIKFFTRNAETLALCAQCFDEQLFPADLTEVSDDSGLDWSGLIDCDGCRKFDCELEREQKFYPA
jgi:hypothetical protein